MEEKENVTYGDVFDVPRPLALPPQKVQRPPEPLSFGRSPLHFPRQAAISQNNNRCCRNAFSKMNVALMFAVAFFAIFSTVFAVMYFTMDKKDKTSGSGSWKYLGHGCVGAKDNQYLELPYPGPSMFIGAVKLVHTIGTVGNGPSHSSYWGGPAQGTLLAMLVTDLKNRVIYPSPRLVTIRQGGWYRLTGYSSTSPELVLSDFQNPKYLRNGEKIRIWYGEDLRDYTEWDNHGKTCMSTPHKQFNEQ